MIVKDQKTVGIGVLHPATHHAMNVVDEVWFAFTGKEARCTGLGEEGHSVRGPGRRGSLHSGALGDVRGRAFDVDADEAHLPATLRPKVEAELRTRLGSVYDLIWEGIGTANAHLHVEYDPKPVQTG